MHDTFLANSQKFIVIVILPYGLQAPIDEPAYSKYIQSKISRNIKRR